MERRAAELFFAFTQTRGLIAAPLQNGVVGLAIVIRSVASSVRMSKTVVNLFERADQGEHRPANSLWQIAPGSNDSLQLSVMPRQFEPFRAT